jgi:hypothetical protein
MALIGLTGALSLIKQPEPSFDDAYSHIRGRISRWKSKMSHITGALHPEIMPFYNAFCAVISAEAGFPDWMCRDM